jgi:L-asparaginase II
MEPISVSVRRGSITESVHLVHAVAVQDGAVVAEAGDRSFRASLRSSAKPLQALPLARAREDLAGADLAIAAASHRGQPEHVEAVRGLLANTGGSEDELECGVQEGRPPEPIYHNCSGKHAGMLAVCRARGWSTAGYRLPEHPLQREILGVVAAAADLAEDAIETGPDGCGVVCFALPLERAATAFSRLDRLDGGDRIAAAMRAHPRLVGGAGATDTDLMETLPGWIAKGGAEGLMCAAGPGALGIALKVADGSGRAHRPALAAFLGRLGLELGEFARMPLRDSRGEIVGELRTA